MTGYTTPDPIVETTDVRGLGHELVVVPPEREPRAQRRHANGSADPAGRRERGIKAYARIFDVPEKEVPAAMAARVGPVFAEEAFIAAGGPAWSHPALTDRERSIVIITALAAQGVAGDRLDSHIRLAQCNGLDYEALTAMMTLMTNYIGQAYGSQAMEAIQRVADVHQIENEVTS